MTAPPQIPIKELAARLKVDPSSLNRTINRMKLERHNNQLPPDSTRQLIMAYTRKSGQRSEDTIRAALGLAREMEIPLPKAAKNLADKVASSAPAPAKKSQPTAKSKTGSSWIERFIQGKVIILLVLLCAISWQIYHTAKLVGRLSLDEVWVSNYAFAIATQFTALLMTVHNRQSVNYLRVFAIIEFLINMAYYRPWHGGGASLDVWAITLLISGTIAYTIFCYSKLLTTKK